MNNKFFGVVRLEESIPENGLVDIEMLRIGKFNHKLHGEMEITDEMLDNMIANFHDGVIGREISFDWNHKAEEASSWLKDIRKEDGVLIGTVDFTEAGKESVRKKEFGYFSIEFNDNYEDPETGEEFGPTILGGALTNRPFITNLKKIVFSMDDVDSSIYKLREDKKMPDIKREPVKKTEENHGEVTLEDLQRKNDELIKKLEEYEKKTEDKKDNVKFEEFIAAQNKQLEAVNKKLEALEAQNVELETRSKNSLAEAKKAKIEKLSNDLLTVEGHHPALVSVVTDIMLNASDDKVVKFSTTVGEGNDAKTVELNQTISEAVLRILEAIPKSQRANYDQKTSSADDAVLLEEEEVKAQDTGMNRAFAKRGLKRLSAVK